MIAGNANNAHRNESVALALLKSASAFFIVSIVVLLGYLTFEGTKLFTVDHKSIFEFLFSPTFSPDTGQVGAAPFILGSLFVTGFAIAVGGPFGLAVGVFFSELAPPRVAAAMKPAIEVLVGIPSVVYGWLGLTLLVPLIRNMTGSTGFGLLSAGIVLSLMILPTVISLAEDAMRVVPNSLREGSLALGATRWETISRVLVPAARSGLAVAVILGIARAIGEALAIQMVLGNSPTIPHGLLNAASALTSEIVMDMGGAIQGSVTQHALFSMALLLLLIAMSLIVLVKFVVRRAT
ncbi:MAG: phosphate ABC transporter permease subunit PstC [Candidatus Eremiobacteraeota bacterium]|nr:phosphate ABC transporter permease subunit PstC [Candidatus Eremiobacteraeota bacterium]